jgi:hypothetical protein
MISRDVTKMVISPCLRYLHVCGVDVLAKQTAQTRQIWGKLHKMIVSLPPEFSAHFLGVTTALTSPNQTCPHARHRSRQTKQGNHDTDKAISIQLQVFFRGDSVQRITAACYVQPHTACLHLCGSESEENMCTCVHQLSAINPSSYRSQIDAKVREAPIKAASRQGSADGTRTCHRHKHPKLQIA